MVFEHSEPFAQVAIREVMELGVHLDESGTAAPRGTGLHEVDRLDILLALFERGAKPLVGCRREDAPQLHIFFAGEHFAHPLRVQAHHKWCA